MRTPLLAANWKMNKTLAEAADLVEALFEALGERDLADREVLLCPPATALATVGALLDGSQIRLGAQNMYHEPSGAYTGEISAGMLREVGCTHVIAGHSERRHVFSEADELINLKIRAALDAGLIPILAVGELLDERRAGAAESTVIGQLEAGLVEVEPDDPHDLVIAYEPVWAIGTGETASPEDAQQMHAAIRAWLAERYGTERADEIRILYGGSVKPANVDELMAQPDIDGALVGGAALQADSFARIILFEPTT